MEINYGKEFIKLYNQELSAFKEDLIARIEKDYGSPVIAKDLWTKYTSELYGKLNQIKDYNDKDGYSTSLLGLSATDLKFKEYNFDRIENVFSRDIHPNFLKKHQYSRFENFNHFMKLFSKYLVLREYITLIDDNKDLFLKHLKNENIKTFFKINITKKDLNILMNYKLLKEEKVSSKREIDLSDNQRMIILHILKNYYKDTKGGTLIDDRDTEYFKITSLCSIALKDDDYLKAKTSNNKYRYFIYGVNNSDKDKAAKINMINEIQKIFTPLKGYNRLKKAFNLYKKTIE